MKINDNGNSMTEAQHCLVREMVLAHELLECLQQEQAHLIQADIEAPSVYGRDGQQNVRTSGQSFVAG